jgi:uncharacterized integral membrane protein
MRIATAFYVVAAVILAVFIVANWSLLATTVELNFIAVRVQAPLFILVLLAIAVILLLDVSVHAVSRHSWMRERRTLKEELYAARLRAEREDDSRVGALRTTVERELATIRGQLDKVIAGHAALFGRISEDSAYERAPTDVSPRYEPELVPIPRAGGDDGRGSGEH